jgi:hypothetical protein
MDENILSRMLGALSEIAGYRPERKVAPHFTGKHVDGKKFKRKGGEKAHKKMRARMASASRKKNRK